MIKGLIGISVFAITLLVAVTIILVVLNWSEKLYNPLISLFLAGTVTTFITVILLLKAESFEASFTTLMVLNSENHLPIWFHPDSPNKRLNDRLSKYCLLGNPSDMRQNGEIATFVTPANDIEERVFNEEILQYRIFDEIIGLHYQSISISGGVAGISGGIRNPFKLSEKDQKPLTDFQSELDKNRFSKNPMQQFYLANYFSKLPKGTEIHFKRIPASEKNGPEKHLIELTKPYFFTIEIVIEAGFATGPGPNSLPKGLLPSPEIARVAKTALFNIYLSAHFERITGGNWRTEELKNWAKWLFVELENRFSDNTTVQ